MLALNAHLGVSLWFLSASSALTPVVGIRFLGRLLQAKAKGQGV